MANPTKAEQKIIDTALKRLDRCVKAESHTRAAAIEDLKFVSGAQWDDGEKKRRADKGRPALQINLLDKFCTQVEGDMMHNSPSIKVRPIDSRADINIAKIRQGIISNIEYLSNSKAVYGYGAKQMVRCGFGAWRVLTRYTEENPFLQEAYLESVRNPFLVYMDPTSKDQNYADAKFGFVLEKMTREEFKDRYPKAQWPSDALKTGSGLVDEHWFDGDLITVAEYFTSESETVEMLQLEDGRVVDREGFEEIKAAWELKNERMMEALQTPPPMPQAPQIGTPPATQAPQIGTPPMPQALGGQPPAAMNPGLALAGQIKRVGTEPRVVKKRNTEKTVIKHRIITCCEILDGGADGNRFPGKYIPIVLLKGRELNIEGKNHVFSLIRFAKDPQKLVNFWNSAAAETIALAPKAPWLGTARQFEGYENDYATANVENYPMLKYNADPEAPGPPQRQAPGQPPVAIFEQIRRGEENIKSVIGMFGSDLGDQGPERTGAAIVARQRPGDIGTYEFMENLSRAILFTGKVLNEIIPEIYDSERDVRLRNIDETETFAPINTTVGQAAKLIEAKPEMYQGLDVNKIKRLLMDEGKEAKFNDVTAGKYDVVVTVGPSYATQRQEAAQHLLQLAQSMPQQMSLAADLIVQNLDFKDADELAGRLRKTLPRNLITPKPGEVLPPPQPTPQQMAIQAKMASEQAKTQISQMKLEQEKLKLEAEKLKLQAEIEKLRLEMGMTIDTKSQERQIAAMEKAERLRLERERLDLERAKFAHQSGMDVAKHRHQADIDWAGMAQGDAGNSY